MGIISPPTSPPTLFLAIPISAYPCLHQFPLSAWFVFIIYLFILLPRGGDKIGEEGNDKDEANGDKNKLEAETERQIWAETEISSVSHIWTSLEELICACKGVFYFSYPICTDDELFGLEGSTSNFHLL